MDVLKELVIQSGESFDHAVEINKAYKCLEPVLDWCKSECKPGWKWQLVNTSSDVRDGRYIFFFNDEKDYLAFCLKWK